MSVVVLCLWQCRRQTYSFTTVDTACPAVLWCSMTTEHEHGFATLTIKLLEQQERFLPEAKTTLLITVDDVERVLPPVVMNIVSLECLQQSD